MFRLLKNAFEKETQHQFAQIHSRFFFAGKGAKKKLIKKKAPKGYFALCGGRPRLRALDGAAFCKRRAKTFGYFDSADDFISCLNIGDVALI